ncbi:hypothetical protein EVAR_21044_1 [Eumeta japonica]|uniref:Uncharacterized protein n=1 Tax=Eumeta variegata TaxID=151549 RepID=A0A4C1UZV8_EUMVA|nr:hypothetical protein EVAR_21044_1 [Eumeta japonica]
MGIYPKITFKKHAALNVWATTVLQRIHATQNRRTACVLCKTYGHMAKYLGWHLCTKSILNQIAEKKNPARSGRAALSTRARDLRKFSYAKVTVGPRKDPPKNVSNDTSTEDIKVLLSVMTSINTSMTRASRKKIQGRANPLEKIIVLAGHSSLVEAIKNNLI